MTTLKHAGILATLLLGSAPLFSQVSSDGSLPPDLRLAMRRATAPSDYAAVAGSDGLRWSASNGAHGMRADFSGEAVTVEPIDASAQPWQLSLQLVGFGRSGQLSAPQAAQASADGVRIEHRRGSLVEWYLNLPQGLEQGFTIEQPPEGDASAPIELRLGVSGTLAARPLAGRTGVSLCAVDGTERLSYSGLAAWDAAGQPLACWMEPAEGAIVIGVDDRGASYPVTVDPFLSTGLRVLVSSDSSAYDELGYAVAVSGDTAVIGAPFEDNSGGGQAGSAYVFTRSATGWTQQAKLIASDASLQSLFGFAVALSGDTAVVGARGGTPSTANLAGLAYVFVRTGTTWSEQARLTASDAATNDGFGAAVALSGERAVIGAPYDDDAVGFFTGSAYVFVRSGGTWSEEAKLTASDASADAYLGSSVALSGDTALVGAILADAPGKLNTGAAYVYVRSGSTWSEQARLLASDGSPYDKFGSAVALADGTALVGAPQDEHVGLLSSGSVYVFVGGGALWSEQARLEATDAGAGSFGDAVALAGEVALVGATYGFPNTGVESGSAYLFERSGTTWAPQAKLVPPDAQSDAQFGWAVALSGHTALLGARFDDHGSVFHAGTAYVFDWADGSRLTASDAGSGDSFGFSVALSGDSAIVGAPFETADYAGSAYVFVRNGDTWSEQAKLTASDAGVGDTFGSAVALSGDTAVIGAVQDDHAAGAEAGSAYVFVRTGTTWTEQAKLIASDAAQFGLFGRSVAVSGDTAVIGALRNDLLGTGMGYVFVRAGTTWTEQAKLTQSDTGSSDWLGYSTSISGETVVLGAPQAGLPGASFAGAAYVFVRQGTSWSQQAKLVAADASSGDFLGYSVSVSGDTVFAGAWQDDHFSVADAGSVYVFDRTGTSWTQTAQLAASEPITEDGFGNSVSLSGGTAIVGSHRHATAGLAEAGSAHVFVRGASGWGEWLGAGWSSPATFEQFGWSVAVDGDTILAGAPGSEAAGPIGAGAAYVGRVSGDWIDLGDGLPGTTGTPSLSGSGILAGGSKAALTLANAKPSALGMLFVSQVSAPVPFKGGTLIPFPPLLSFALFTQPDGSLPIAFTWPGGVPASTAIWFQYAIADPAAVQHVALSNALKATTP